MVLRLTSEAAAFAKESVTMIKNALAADTEVRKAGKHEVSLASILKPESILTDEQEAMQIQAKLTAIRQQVEEEDGQESKVIKDDGEVVEMVSDSDDDSDIAEVPVVKEKEKPVEQIDIGSGDDSEEETTTTIKGQETMQGRSWYKQSEKW